MVQSRDAAETLKSVSRYFGSFVDDERLTLKTSQQVCREMMTEVWNELMGQARNVTMILVDLASRAASRRVLRVDGVFSLH